MDSPRECRGALEAEMSVLSAESQGLFWSGFKEQFDQSGVYRRLLIWK